MSFSVAYIAVIPESALLSKPHLSVEFCIIYTSDPRRTCGQTHIHHLPSCGCYTDALTKLSKWLQCRCSALVRHKTFLSITQIYAHLKKHTRKCYVKHGICQPSTKSLGLTLLILRKNIFRYSLSTAFNLMPCGQHCTNVYEELKRNLRLGCF